MQFQTPKDFVYEDSTDSGDDIIRWDGSIDLFRAGLLAGKKCNPFDAQQFFLMSVSKDRLDGWKAHVHEPDRSVSFSFPKRNKALTLQFDWPFGCMQVYVNERTNENKQAANPDCEPVRLDPHGLHAPLCRWLAELVKQPQWSAKLTRAKVVNLAKARARRRARNAVEQANVMAAALETYANRKAAAQ
jgi:hypothetical protein